MAYPLIKYPTFGQFINKLGDKKNIKIQDMKGRLNKQDQPPISVHYLEGIVGDKTIRYVVDIQDFDAPIAPSLHRSICDRFELDQEEFGAD